MIVKENALNLIVLIMLIPAGMTISQHKHHKVVKADSVTFQSVVYTCPMDPEVRSSNPGVCPKCGLDLVKMESTAPSDTVKKARPTKAQLIDDGRYNCCLKDACDQCYKEGGDCECYTSVKKTGTVCKECFEGWQHGKGRVPGIKKDSVKTEMD